MKSLRRPFPAFAAFVFVLLFAGPKLVFAAQYDQRLANLSTRGQIGTGANIMITGFVVNEGAPKKVLVRAARYALARLGLATNTLLANPTPSIYNGAGQLVLQNDT